MKYSENLGFGDHIKVMPDNEIWICWCSNTPDQEGFEAYDENRHDEATYFLHDKGQTGNLFACLRCGRILGFFRWLEELENRDPVVLRCIKAVGVLCKNTLTTQEIETIWIK